VKDTGHSWFLEAAVRSCGQAQGRVPCPVPAWSWLLPAAEASAVSTVPQPGWGPGCCRGGRVRCALHRLTVQLRPQNKTSLSRVSEQPKPELMEQTGVKGEGFCQSQ